MFSAILNVLLCSTGLTPIPNCFNYRGFIVLLFMSGPQLHCCTFSGFDSEKRKSKWKDKFVPLPSSFLFGNGHIVLFTVEQEGLWRHFLSACGTSALAHWRVRSRYCFLSTRFMRWACHYWAPWLCSPELWPTARPVISGSTFRVQGVISENRTTTYTSLQIHPPLLLA